MSLFESSEERRQRHHNQGQTDGATSESTVLGETNKHVPFFGWGESERELNKAYEEGFKNGKNSQK